VIQRHSRPKSVTNKTVTIGTEGDDLSRAPGWKAMGNHLTNLIPRWRKAHDPAFGQRTIITWLNAITWKFDQRGNRRSTCRESDAVYWVYGRWSGRQWHTVTSFGRRVKYKQYVYRGLWDAELSKWRHFVVL